MNRIFIGGIATETNTFSAVPTGLKDFQNDGLFRGNATQSPPTHFTSPLHCWRRRAESDGYEVIEGLMTYTQPGGTTTHDAWEALKNMLLEDLRQAGSIDMILLNLHGAMVADGHHDCEGELLQAIREISGPTTIIGCELDLHCVLTNEMVDAATLIVPYKEYPHTDILDRAEDLYTLCDRAMRGEITPVAGRAECHMLSVWHTTREPMKSFVAEMFALENDNSAILSVSFCHGFALADTPQLGSRMLVYADKDPELAKVTAEKCAEKIWDMRHKTRHISLGAQEVVQRAMQAKSGPVVIADAADNPGTGAGGDSTFILSALLDQEAKGAVFGLMYDPMAVASCCNAGIGTRMTVRVGGKFGPFSGPPLDLQAIVKNIRENHTQTTVAGQTMTTGTAVWIDVDGVDVVLCDKRVQTFHPNAFTEMGIELSNRPIICVKSTQHFYAGFAPIASEVLYSRTESAIQFEGPVSPYKHRDGNYWPVVEDPRAAAQ